MALGLAVDLCQVGLNQGDDLFAYMDDRIAAGAEFVAASNFGGVDTGSLPWKNYNYADCRGTMGAGWLMTGVNTGGAGEYRPYWDRLIGYYEGLRGVKMQYSEAASTVRTAVASTTWGSPRSPVGGQLPVPKKVSPRSRATLFIKV